MRQHAHLLVACLVVVWGCNWPINKVVLNHIPPLWFACLRVGTGGLTFLLVQALGTKGIKLPARSDWAVVVSIGLFQVAAGTTWFGQCPGRPFCHSFIYDSDLGITWVNHDPWRTVFSELL